MVGSGGDMAPTLPYVRGLWGRGVEGTGWCALRISANLSVDPSRLGEHAAYSLALKCLKNSSFDSFSPSSVRTTDLALPLGLLM